MATLQYDFRVVGLNTVMAAFRSLEQRALQHNRTISRAFGGGAGGGAGSASARTGGRGAQHDAHVKAHARERERMLRQQVTDQQRANTALERARQQEIRNQDRHAVRQINIARRMENERKREIARAQKEQERAAAIAFRERRRAVQSRYEAGVGALTGLGSRAASVLALGGGAALAAGISNELQLGKSTTLLAVMAKQAGEQGNVKEIQKGLLSRVREVGKTSGLDRNDLSSVMTAFFSKSGDVSAAKEMLPVFAEMADITGASLEDIGNTAGMAYMQAIAKGMSKEEAKGTTKKILAAFAGQAAVGTIEMRDFAAYGPSLLSTAARFSGDYGRMAAVTAAMAQTGAYGGANKAAEAATSLARFADILRDNSEEFEKLGVKTFERNAQGIAVTRDPVAIIKEVLSKTEGGDERILAKYFSNVRSMRAVAGFNTMYKAAGGGAAGMQAVERHLDRFLSAQLSEQQIREGVAAIRETPARQFEAALNDLKEEIGINLLPALTQLAPAMGQLVLAIKPVIEWFGKFASQAAADPFKTVGDIIKVAVTASIAQAAIGAAIQAAILKQIVGTGGTPGAPGAPGAPPGGGKGGGPGGGGGGQPATPSNAPTPTPELPKLLDKNAKIGLGPMAVAAVIADSVAAAYELLNPISFEEEQKKDPFKRRLPLSFGLTQLDSEASDILLNGGRAKPGLANFTRGVAAGFNTELFDMFGAQQQLDASIAKGGFNMEAAAKLDSMTDKQKGSIETFAKAVAMFESAIAGITGVAGTPLGVLGNLFGGLLPPNRGDGPGTPSSGGSR